ncbi:MAG: polysaccharide deacetylase family protein, partial [Gammaproteobacteria bacterium]|nr:polysaccharide deacetylase family protein [Gammaproteobacteria bacterium]
MTQIINALTVDVEDYFHVAAFNQVIKPNDWDGMQWRFNQNTKRMLDLFDQFGVKATFFVLGWCAERDKALVAEIDRRGHEVASHGYSHQLVYSQTPEQFRSETIKSKDILESITGKPVKGYRAASY